MDLENPSKTSEDFESFATGLLTNITLVLLNPILGGSEVEKLS